MRRDNLVAYTGIADQDGLESFHLIDDKFDNYTYTFMSLRVKFNDHRTGVVYRAFLYPEDAKAIDTVLNGKTQTRFKLALEMLKEKAVQLEAIGPGAQDRWDRIPYYTSKELVRPPKESKDTGQLDLLDE